MHLTPVLRGLSRSSLLILTLSLIFVVNAQGPPGSNNNYNGGGPPAINNSGGGGPPGSSNNSGGGDGGPPGGNDTSGGGPPGSNNNSGGGGPPGSNNNSGGGGGGPPSSNNNSGGGGPPGAHENSNHDSTGTNVPESKARYDCPADEGKLYTTPDDVSFKLRCDWAAYVANLPGSNVQTTSLSECADHCTTFPGCLAADWTKSSGECNPKALNALPGRHANEYHQWQRIPRCPASSLSAPKDDPITVTTPICPDDDGNLFTTSDGAHWMLQCCTHNFLNKEIGTRTVEADHVACATKCALTSGCKSFVFSALAQNPNTGPDAFGTCKLYSTGGFSTKGCGDTTHDYAFIATPPAEESPEALTAACPTECPLANGRQYTARAGEVFHMDCEKRHGTRVLYEDDQESFKDCMDACSAMTACHSVDYHTNSRTCYYSNHHGEPEHDAVGFQSAHSLGCSKACEQGCCGAKDSSTGAIA